MSCDMGLKIHIRRKQVGAFTDPGERGGEDLVALPLQRGAHPLPAPAAVPGAVDQYKCRHWKVSRNSFEPALRLVPCATICS